MKYALDFALAMMLLVTREDPAITRDDVRHSQWRDNTMQLAEINERVTMPAALIAPFQDQAILTALEFYESRFRLDTPDGDCLTEHTKLTPAEEKRYRNPTTQLIPDWLVQQKARRTCKAAGVTQVGKGLFSFKWAAYSIEPQDGRKAFGERLRKDPEFAVRAAYVLLQHWKAECGGGAAVWLSAYGQGKCPRLNKSGNYALDFEGKRRCAMANELANKVVASNVQDAKPTTRIECGPKK